MEGVALSLVYFGHNYKLDFNKLAAIHQLFIIQAKGKGGELIQGPRYERGSKTEPNAFFFNFKMKYSFISRLEALAKNKKKKEEKKRRKKKKKSQIQLTPFLKKKKKAKKLSSAIKT